MQRPLARIALAGFAAIAPALTIGARADTVNGMAERDCGPRDLLPALCMPGFLRGRGDQGRHDLGRYYQAARSFGVFGGRVRRRLLNCERPVSVTDDHEVARGFVGGACGHGRFRRGPSWRDRRLTAGPFIYAQRNSRGDDRRHQRNC